MLDGGVGHDECAVAAADALEAISTELARWLRAEARRLLKKADELDGGLKRRRRDLPRVTPGVLAAGEEALRHAGDVDSLAG